MPYLGNGQKTKKGISKISFISVSYIKNIYNVGMLL